jgi:hypothetical protein
VVDLENAVKAVGSVMAGGHLGFVIASDKRDLSAALRPRRMVKVTKGISGLHGLGRTNCAEALSARTP